VFDFRFEILGFGFLTSDFGSRYYGSGVRGIGFSGQGVVSGVWGLWFAVCGLRFEV